MSAVHTREAVSQAPVSLSVTQNDKPMRAGLRKRVGSLGALYAHALLIEREAVERYREFATNMAEHGNDAVAALFEQLAEFESEHAFHLAKKTAGMNLPKLNVAEHAWLDQESPLPEAHAFIYRMLTPRMALEIALRAEKHAKTFFDRVLAEENDAGICEVAKDMARDEEAHIAWVSEALARVPMPYQPNEDLPGDPTIPQQL
jgi:rubrerythrin